METVSTLTERLAVQLERTADVGWLTEVQLDFLTTLSEQLLYALTLLSSVGTPVEQTIMHENITCLQNVIATLQTLNERCAGL